MSSPLAVWAIAPLLAASNSLLSGLLSGVAAFCVWPLCVYALRRLGAHASQAQRCLLAGLTAALLLSSLLMGCAAWRLELANALMLPLSLLLLPCMALALNPSASLRSSCHAGGRFLLLASLLGAIREGLSQGGVLLNSQALLGIELSGAPFFSGLPFFSHASMSLIVLGLLLALYQLISADRP